MAKFVDLKNKTKTRSIYNIFSTTSVRMIWKVHSGFAFIYGYMLYYLDCTKETLLI